MDCHSFINTQKIVINCCELNVELAELIYDFESKGVTILLVNLCYIILTVIFLIFSSIY
jgi:hypothetical protein